MSDVNPRRFTVLSEGENPIVDIVFIHGLGGHPKDTWTYKPSQFSSKPSIFWPRDLLRPKLPNARILTWGYESSPTNLNLFNPVSQVNIFQHSRNFLDDLVDQRVESPDRPIIFICHSLGGILVKDALQASREATFKPEQQAILRATSMIIFFGTPHRGSHWAEWVKKLTILSIGRVERRILDSLNVNSETLQRIASSFAVMLKEDLFKIVSFSEGLGISEIPGFTDKIVDEFSSTIEDAAATAYTLHANHLSMCKFESESAEGFDKVLAKLRAQLIQIANPAPPPDPLRESPQGVRNWYIRAPVSDFQGRASLLERMNTYFFPEGNFAHGKKPLVLTGLGGIGKSEVALEHALKSSDKYKAGFQVDAATHESILQGYASIATLLGLGPAPSPQPTQPSKTLLVPLVNAWFATNQDRWLLIFDNYDNPQQVHLHSYIPKSALGHVIVTSRRVDVGNIGTLFPVEPMEKQEACHLLLSLSGRNPTTCSKADLDRAKTISEYVGQLPLGIVLAAAYVKSPGSGGLKRYAKLIEEQDENAVNDYLRKWSPADQSFSDYPFGVFDTWQRSLHSLTERNEDAAKFLRLCSFFSRSQLHTRIFRRSLQTKKQWTSLGKLEDLFPRDAGVPSWMVDIFAPRGTWEQDGFIRVLIDLENFSFMRLVKGAGTTESLPSEDSSSSDTSDQDSSESKDEPEDYELWMHPLVHQWAKSCLSPTEKSTFSLDATWVFLHSIRDCAGVAEQDLLGFKWTHNLDSWAHVPSSSHGASSSLVPVGLSQAVIGEFLKEMAMMTAGPKAVRDLFRAGQFQTGGGGMINSFADLMIILQAFRTFLDRAYCSETDPDGLYRKLPLDDFRDTYAILIAFQQQKRNAINLANAGPIFKRALDYLQWKDEYASALLLSVSVVNDARHWDNLVQAAPRIDNLISNLRAPQERFEFSILTIAACTQLAISYAFAVGLNHHNNTNPRVDPMNYLDPDRHTAVVTIWSVGNTALRSLELLKAYQDAFEGKIPVAEVTITKSAQWQLQLSYAFACLREGRPDEAKPIFDAAISNAQVFKGHEASRLLEAQAHYAIETQAQIGADVLTFLEPPYLVHDGDVSHDDRDNFFMLLEDGMDLDPAGFPATLATAAPAPVDTAELLPRITLGRKPDPHGQKRTDPEAEPEPATAGATAWAIIGGEDV